MHTPEELLVAQQALEQESLDIGVAKYRKLQALGEADLPPGQLLIKQLVEPVRQAIIKWLDEARSGTPSKSLGVFRFLDQFAEHPEIPAYVTCRQAVHGFASQQALQHVAGEIAKVLEDQVNHEALKAENPRAYRQLLKKIEKTPSPGYRHIVLRRQQKYAGVAVTKWGISERTRLGVLLLELMQQATGRFNIEHVFEGKNNTPLKIVATPDTINWLVQGHFRSEFLTPTHLPMVVQPKPWSNPFNGGFLNKKMRMPMIKRVNSTTLAELKDHEMPIVYRAVNALQDTAWAINTSIREAVVNVWDSGSTLGGLPGREPVALPAKGFTSDTPSDDPAVKAWKAKAAEVYERNVVLGSKRIQVQCKLWVAEKMSAFERFHFVHTLDFRGRAYAVGAFLNPQGDDLAKALLQFANGKALGENGAFWLAVHGANCFGVDKAAFDERTKWVEDHLAEIMDSAVNPLDGQRFWTQADSPWQFLAFCKEWTRLQVYAHSNDAESFVSHLPVGMDGACNGLQNFSALLRDEIGGKATNLTPNETPSDIYAEVAVKAQVIIDRLASEGDETAQRWVGKMNRKLTKRNTMTVPYAVTQFGMRDQLMAVFKELREEEGCDESIVNANLSDAILLARVNYEAIGQVVVAARAAMDWLRETARVVASDDLPVQWVTPSGLVVVQDYREMLGDKLDFTVCGRRFQLLMERRGTKLNRRRQSSGISPNFIHALDAAHLQRTVNLCLDHGITDFAMIHDSYGAHAGEVQTMAQLLRQAFVDQYSGDVLGDFRDQMIEQITNPKLAEKIPPRPPMGNLELTAVLDSDYFFA